uniref:Uncharacterized protein n=1 Tax=Cannabis sativa TaxID=3483 RepID=A0A803PC37_CANSA
MKCKLVWYLLFFYPMGLGKWTWMVPLADGFSGPWLGGGDLNEILHQYEKSDEFDYRELVPGTWNSGSGHRINGVQDNIRQAISILKGWNRDVYKRTLGAIKKKKYELAHLDTGWHFNQQKDKEIDVLMYKDEKYWASLAKNSWMMLGDKNSAFFHQSASHRKKMNLIRGIFYHNSVWVEEPSRIAIVFEQYFGSLFTSHQPSLDTINHVLNSVQSRVTNNLNNILMRPFIEADVRKALFQMHPSKIPSKDGMGAGFYQKF